MFDLAQVLPSLHGFACQMLYPEPSRDARSSQPDPSQLVQLDAGQPAQGSVAALRAYPLKPLFGMDTEALASLMA